MSDIKKKELICYDRAEICNNTTSQMRGNMFAPLDKSRQSNAYKEFVKNDMILTFKYGEDTLQIRNRLLTQRHRDLLDLMFKRAEKKEIKEGYIIMSDFSEYEILRDLGHKDKHNRNWLRKLIRELQDINIVYINNKKEVAFHIVRAYKINKITGKHTIIFDDNYINYFYNKGIGVDYKHMIGDIIALDSPVLKALVRFVISNSFDKFKMSLVKILESIGINKENTGERQYRRIIKIIKNNKAILKEKFNIVLTDNDIIEYEKLANISFYNINKEQANCTLQYMIEEQKKKDEEEIKESLKFYYSELI